MYVYKHTTYMPGACEGQKRVLDSLELELWMAVNQHVVFSTLTPKGTFLTNPERPPMRGTTTINRRHNSEESSGAEIRTHFLCPSLLSPSVGNCSDFWLGTHMAKGKMSPLRLFLKSTNLIQEESTLKI